LKACQGDFAGDRQLSVRRYETVCWNDAHLEFLIFAFVNVRRNEHGPPTERLRNAQDQILEKYMKAEKITARQEGSRLRCMFIRNITVAAKFLDKSLLAINPGEVFIKHSRFPRWVFCHRPNFF